MRDKFPADGIAELRVEVHSELATRAEEICERRKWS